MPNENDKPQFHGVFLTDAEDGTGEPVAVFRNADEAQRYRRAQYGNGAIVAPVEVSVKANNDVAALIDSRRTAAAPAAPPADPNAAQKAQIRARLAAEEREKALEAEVRREMAAEQRRGEISEPARAGAEKKG